MTTNPVSDRCVHDLFADHATKGARRTALVCQSRSVSYGELDEHANRLANYLVEQGVRAGDLVGVHLERGMWMVVAVLAALKAGAAYLMVEPHHPPQRVRDLVAGAGASAVVTGARSGRWDVPVVAVDADAAAIAEQPATAPEVTVRPDDLACVMYTSGSTGEPKGIAAPHRAIVGTLTGQDYLDFSAGAVWLQCAPVSWDAFALELWGALLFGATCVLYPGQRPDPVVLARLVAEHRVSTMYLSGSLFNVVVDEYPDALLGVGQLMVGGEALSPVHVDRALARYPDLRLGNGYGPVECMIFVATHPVTRDCLDAGRSVPIGLPLTGKRGYVLDERLRPVEGGEVGELYAAGVGLAHGYLGRPELTAERFVADPFGPPGSRLYRTGDLVRRNADGLLEFVGRTDRQLKIRGFRVEPAEVETVLARHPAVRRAAVVARDDPPGERRLVAYVVPHAERSVTSDQLRAHASGTLPDHLVPAEFRTVPDLPLTATGKLDYAALSQPDAPAPAINGPDGTLTELFADQAARTPGATALVFAGAGRSYAELDAWANRLAHALVERGAGPERYVAVAIPRSFDLVVALLGVLKAGAAYLPVDPDYPAGRIRQMLDDAEPVLVLTELPAHLDRYPDTSPALTVLPDHPAYLIYTSGSTGRPKGVAVSHRSIVNRLRWMNAEYPLDATERVLHKTPTSFDVSVPEIFCPLISGATLVLARPNGHRDPAYLAEIIQRERITQVHFVPSMLREFLAEPAAARCTGLRRVICSGEALTNDLADDLHATLDVTLLNLYGPTEATVDVTHWECGKARSGRHSVPIGHPVSNTGLHVLDARLRRVPTGAAGELYLTGVQLARGYLNQAARTAERFVADPYGPPGSRMYRTGDLVRSRPDGALEFLGRTDHQVKIRGFRVELGEIEAAMASPAVRQVVVVAGEDAHGMTRLVGYVVPVDRGAFDPVEFRRRLRAVLPGYMVPGAIVALDEFPLAPNGKLDRAALPDPAAHVRVTAAAPRTETERILAGLFAQLLGLPRIGIDDDFFDLGGHSLLITRLWAGIRAALGVDLPIAALYDAPTVAALAERVEAGGRTDRDRPALLPASRPAVVPLSFAQRRLWILSQLGDDRAYTLPVLARLRGTVDRDALAEAFRDVVARHEALRTIFVATGAGTEPAQRVVDDANPRLALVAVEPGELAARITDATSRRFDLSTEVPVRATLFSTSATEHALLVVMHHIAVDGWSLAPLLRDLAEAYAARLGGAAPDWSPLPVQYADFALWQRELLGDAREPSSLLAGQLRYWREALRGLPERLSLPRRPEPPAAPGDRADVIVGHLDAELHARLEMLAARYRCTLFMVLQAGLAVVLQRMGAGDDIPIGAPVAGRGERVLDDLVGFFVNTLVLRVDLSGDPTVGELLGRVRARTLAAYDHQDLPFELLVDELRPERVPGVPPLIPVVLAWQNNIRAELTMPGVVSTVEVRRPGAARFGLLIEMSHDYAADGGTQGIEVAVEYRTDMFGQAFAVSLARALTHTLDAMAAAPDATIGVIDVPVTARHEDPAAHREQPPEPHLAAPGHRAPRTELERRIAATWAQVLGLPEIGVEDNFFALGGNSLMAIRAAARLVTRERLPVTTEQIFACGTVAALARDVAGDTDGRLEPRGEVPIPRLPRRAAARTETGEGRWT